MRKVLRPSQAAKRLDVCVTTIWRWIRAGKFREGTVTNLGSKENPRYRIAQAEVERIATDGL